MIDQQNCGWQKVIALMMSCIMLSVALTPGIATAQTCEEGKWAGEEDGNAAGSPAWILAGIGCGCLGVAGAALIVGQAPVENFIGQSPEFIACYMDSYKKARRERQITYSIIGWGIWMVIYFAAIYPDTKDDD